MESMPEVIQERTPLTIAESVLSPADKGSPQRYDFSDSEVRHSQSVEINESYHQLESDTGRERVLQQGDARQQLGGLSHLATSEGYGTSPQIFRTPSPRRMSSLPPIPTSPMPDLEDVHSQEWVVPDAPPTGGRLHGGFQTSVRYGYVPGPLHTETHSPQPVKTYGRFSLPSGVGSARPSSWTIVSPYAHPESPKDHRRVSMASDYTSASIGQYTKPDSFIPVDPFRASPVVRSNPLGQTSILRRSEVRNFDEVPLPGEERRWSFGIESHFSEAEDPDTPYASHNSSQTLLTSEAAASSASVDSSHDSNTHGSNSGARHRRYANSDNYNSVVYEPGERHDSNAEDSNHHSGYQTDVGVYDPQRPSSYAQPQSPPSSPLGSPPRVSGRVYYLPTEQTIENQNTAMGEVGRVKALQYFLERLLSQIYLHILLRLPSLYFSRVAHIFEEADLTLSQIKEMAYTTTLKARSRASLSEIYDDLNALPQYEKLQATWVFFIDSVMREWKTFNIISVLLLSAILTVLQMDGAANEPITRYSALLSLVCALVSLLYGCMYIIRFGSMRKTYKAAEWAMEAQRSQTFIWWNVWVLLSLPAIWLTWSIFLYLACIMSFVWLTGPQDDGPMIPMSRVAIILMRIGITMVLGVGIVFGVLILDTFRKYGEVMDRAWKNRIDGWIEEKRAAGAGTRGSLYSNPKSPKSTRSRQHIRIPRPRTRSLSSQSSDTYEPAQHASSQSTKWHPYPKDPEAAVQHELRTSSDTKHATELNTFRNSLQVPDATPRLRLNSNPSSIAILPQINTADPLASAKRGHRSVTFGRLPQ